MLARYALNPFYELTRLQREMNNLFDDYGSESETYPALNLWSDNQQAIVTAEIPGIDTKDLNITVNNSLLTLEGEKKEEDLGKDAVYHRSERGTGKFSRTIRLPFEADEGKISAAYTNGVLKITIPRAEASKPRKIEITKG
ncbi:MAG: Hsp20/alpha crystallin family protein [Candidatus Aureabacteria bacterium]|nr:Hsp20/alpha crystallin family protein [Candidatus Auribacterota bacterium]